MTSPMIEPTQADRDARTARFLADQKAAVAALAMLPDSTRVRLEAWLTGNWGEWRITGLPTGLPGTTGWCRDIREVWANNLYAVLVRPVETRWGKVQHCAIRTASDLEPPWRDKHRIKSEIFGPDSIAVEVLPEDCNIVDAADLYHIWVLPDGFEMPFTIASKEPHP